MRKVTMMGLGIVLSLAFATSGFALEKRIAYSGQDRPDNADWRAGTTATISYWNGCVGWTWVWSGWGANDTFGVCFDAQDVLPGVWSTQLLQSTVFVWSESPPGYGFTGTVDVSAADANCCPAGNLATQAWLIGPASTWVVHNWNVQVPRRFVVSHTTGGALSPTAGDSATTRRGSDPGAGSRASVVGRLGAVARWPYTRQRVGAGRSRLR